MADLPTAPVTGRFTTGLAPYTRGLGGVSVAFIPDTPGNVVYGPGGAIVQRQAVWHTDNDGYLAPAAAVLASDAPGITPAGFTYQVVVTYDGQPLAAPFHVAAMGGIPIDVTDPAVVKPGIPSGLQYVDVHEGPTPPANKGSLWVDTADGTDWWAAGVAAVNDAAAAGVGTVNNAAAAAVAAHLGTYDRTGTGSPQGVVAAPVGTRYRDTAATLGAIMWVKASGTGTTGWQVVYGDTGRRLLTVPETTGGKLVIRRTAEMVTMWFSDLTLSSTGTLTIADVLPVGFRPDTATYDFMAATRAAGSTEYVRGIRLSSSGVMNLYNYTPGMFVRAVLTFDPGTVVPWPTVLPGTPA